MKEEYEWQWLILLLVLSDIVTERLHRERGSALRQAANIGRVAEHFGEGDFGDDDHQVASQFGVDDHRTT